MTDEEKASDIYDICLEKKSICCIRKMGEETCSKCKTYKMYKLGLEEGRKEECLEQNKDGTIRPCEVMKENEELKEMFEFVCKQRFGYAWNLNRDVYIADIKKALKGEKTRWV